MSQKKKRKKFWDYFFNVMLVVLVLVFLIPSWRVSFQGWFQSWFLSDAELSIQLIEPMADELNQWAIFDKDYRIHDFNEFKSKPVVLSFWATWCPPCRAELPELSALKNSLDNKINVIAVSEESVDVILNSGLTEDYDFLYSTQSIPSSFNVTSYPTLVILDKHFNMVYKQEGAANLNTDENKSFLLNLADTP